MAKKSVKAEKTADKAPEKAEEKAHPRAEGNGTVPEKAATVNVTLLPGLRSRLTFALIVVSM